jgi:hypothetical protein
MGWPFDERKLDKIQRDQDLIIELEEANSRKLDRILWEQKRILAILTKSPATEFSFLFGKGRQ